MCVGEVGNAISKLCPDQATEYGLVSGSDEPVVGILGWRKIKWMKRRCVTVSETSELTAGQYSAKN